MTRLTLLLLFTFAACGEVTPNPTQQDSGMQQGETAVPDTNRPPSAAIPDGGPLDVQNRESLPPVEDGSIPPKPADAGTPDTGETLLPICDPRFECKVEGPLNGCRCP